MDKFKELGIIEPILQAISEFGFEKPTEVQEKAIPELLKGKDIIAGAATGSGKTLAFGSGIIQNSERKDVIQSLILVPTRELAEQVRQELKKFSKYKKMRIVDIYGGVAITKQITRLKKADIVVGTPGRLLDHLQRGTIELGYVQSLVLDEADRMLDMGFIIDVKKLISQCPKERQTMLFSATLSHNILKLSEDCMNNPLEISCKSDVDPSKLKQIYYDVPDYLKFSTLVHYLKKDKSGLVMVFCNTQKNTDFVARNLQDQGINALAIHGGHTQDRRRKTMEQFHSNDVDVLVCTDVAARGLDIKGVSHVYNYDTPKEPEQYIHRIGRTARAGKEGEAITIIASRDYECFGKLTQTYPDLPIKKEELGDVQKVEIKFRSDSFRRPRNNGFSQANRYSKYSKDRGPRRYNHDRKDREDKRDRRERGERNERYGRDRAERFNQSSDRPYKNNNKNKGRSSRFRKNKFSHPRFKRN